MSERYTPKEGETCHIHLQKFCCGRRSPSREESLSQALRELCEAAIKIKDRLNIMYLGAETKMCLEELELALAKIEEARR